MKLWFSLVLVLALPAVAHADQCQLVDDDVATRALDVLRRHANVLAYCEPCGDRAPGEPLANPRIAKTQGTGGAYQITIDRREVDLAYTYVQTHLDRYENLALLAGCPASGVSPSLTVTAANSGVMIQGDARPITAAVHHGEVVAAEPAPRASWAPVLVAIFATAGLWALIALVLVHRRQVVAMRPRAVNLIDRSTRDRSADL